MKITTKQLEQARDNLDDSIIAENEYDVRKALWKANLLDALIEQGVEFNIPDYIKEPEGFVSDLLDKAHLFVEDVYYRIYAKVRANSTGTFYNGIQVMPYYQLVNLSRCADFIGQFKMKG